MGAVYEAVQFRLGSLTLGKRVAVKLMARELAANSEALARFHREAQVTSLLGHPHLVTVIDFGMTGDGEPYFIMEYLEGEDLEHRLRRVRRMPVEAVVHVVRQVASALSAAHELGIVHRDLKPGNVFLMRVDDEPDFVKVLDFGISKMKTAHTQLTSVQTIMGTPNYMSPEQVGGLVEEIDHRTDQWALGCMAWEMLLGRCPFVADDNSALFYQIINLAPSPLVPRVPGLPPEAEQVLRRALEKQPAARYFSMREFARALETASLGVPVDATPAPVGATAIPALSATIGYGEARVLPATSAPSDFGEDLDVEVSEESTVEPPPVDDLISMTVWSRVRPLHLILAGAVVLLLLLAALLSWRSGTTAELLRSTLSRATLPRSTPSRATLPRATLSRATPSSTTPVSVPSPPLAAAAALFPRAPGAVQATVKPGVPSGSRVKHSDVAGGRLKVKSEDRDPFEDSKMPKAARKSKGSVTRILDDDPFEKRR